MPDTPIDIKSKVFILQHPLEEKRNLRTAKIIELLCPDGHCTVIRSRKFSVKRDAVIKRLLESPERDRTLLLYPGPTAVTLKDIPAPAAYNICILDGTWNQAQSMYSGSPELHSLQKVEIEFGRPSSYVIRTQPMEQCLSTVETAALALAHVESDPSIFETFMKPLQALCDFQLSHGAQKHTSKEFLVLNGLYDKPIPKNILRKLRKNKEDSSACLLTPDTGGVPAVGK